MHDLDATQNDTRAAEVLEPEHRSDDAFFGSLVLLNHVVQIFDLMNLDRCVSVDKEGNTADFLLRARRSKAASIQQNGVPDYRNVDHRSGDMQCGEAYLME
jgi:hypothetical protein